jgi:hypothetical protein
LIFKRVSDLVETSTIENIASILNSIGKNIKYYLTNHRDKTDYLINSIYMKTLSQIENIDMESNFGKEKFKNYSTIATELSFFKKSRKLVTR